MGFQKGNKLGNGKTGKSGRKSKVEEIKRAIEDLKDKITTEALIELARSKVYKQINEIGDTPLGAKDFAMPIMLKSMTDKTDITTKGESLNIATDKVKSLADELRNNNRRRSI